MIDELGKKLSSKWTMARFGESRLARIAAKSLNPQTSIGSESFGSSVLASQAGHMASPVVFCAEKPENEVVGFKCGSTPRLNLFPVLGWNRVRGSC